MSDNRIRPNTLCWLLRCDHDPAWVGRVVTAVREVRAGQVRDSRGQTGVASCWVVCAPWLPPCPYGAAWAVEARHLQPIVDPDADLSEPASDPLHADLVERLTVTRAVVQPEGC